MVVLGLVGLYLSPENYAATKSPIMQKIVVVMRFCVKQTS